MSGQRKFVREKEKCSVMIMDGLEQARMTKKVWLNNVKQTNISEC